MSFNGSGSFLINTAGQPVVSGTVISSTAFNALTADLATGLSTCITKDGQTTVTANIPMANYKFTGLGAGSAAADSANLSQVQSTVVKLLASVSGTDTITAVGSPTVAAYAAGQMFYFVAAGDNTGAVTINIDSLGAKAVTRDGSVALVAGDIKSGEVVVIVYDGTRFQVVSQLNSAGNATFANVSITSALNVGGVATFSAGTAAAPSITTSGDTNNGIFFPATDVTAITTAGSERLRVDASGNLGLGVTPSAWEAGWTPIQGGGYSLGSGNAVQMQIGSNWYNNAGYKYRGTGSAALYQQSSGVHSWHTAASGTAGNTITFTQAMTLDASGQLSVGTTAVTTAGSGYQAFTINGANGSNLALNGGGTNIGLIYAATGNSNLYVTNQTASGNLIFGAGSGNERARIDSSGNLGLGVTPTATAGVTEFAVGSASTNPRISGIRDGSNAFLVYGDSSGTDFYERRNLYLRFGTNNTERARITAAGEFLVGKTTTAASPSGCVLSANGNCLFTITSSIADSLNLYSDTASAYRFYVTNGGTVFATNTTISAISDQRLKENIRELDVGLDAIMALKPRKFDWKKGKGQDKKDVRGFIAQEFEQVFPDLIDIWKDPAPEGEEPYKSVRQDLIPVLVKAIQELKAELDAAKVKIAALEAK